MTPQRRWFVHPIVHDHLRSSSVGCWTTPIRPRAVPSWRSRRMATSCISQRIHRTFPTKDALGLSAKIHPRTAAISSRHFIAGDETVCRDCSRLLDAAHLLSRKFCFAEPYNMPSCALMNITFRHTISLCMTKLCDEICVDSGEIESLGSTLPPGH